MYYVIISKGKCIYDVGSVTFLLGREKYSRQNLNEYLETLNLAPTQFYDQPGLNRKT